MGFLRKCLCIHPSNYIDIGLSNKGSLGILHNHVLKCCFHTSNLQCKNPHSLKGKSVTAQKWLRRQLNDPYVKQARHDSYRCRSAFKLLEIDDRFKILQPGQTVIDCGAAPGSWSQVAVQRTNALQTDPKLSVGRVISVDLQDMMPLPGAVVLSQSDFTKQDVQLKMLQEMQGQRAHVVISDMAPRATGVKSMDHDLIIELCLSALVFASKVSEPGATFVCKMWQGSEQQRLLNAVKEHYEQTKWVKPHASRTDSAELFLIAKGFKLQLKV